MTASPSGVSPGRVLVSATGDRRVGRKICRAVVVMLAVAFMAPDGVRAQPSSPSVQGVVLDGATQEPVRDAVVRWATTRVVSDERGRFVIVLAQGSRRLTISAAGYFEAEVDITVTDDAAPSLEVLLFSRSLVTETVEVTGAAPQPETPSTTQVEPRQVLEAAGSIDNIFRTLGTLPGVAATDDFGSRLSVRGGSPDQNLTLMDGVEIHNPYRLFGLTSAFNPETIDTFDLTAGGFSSRYGDRLSSLLVVNTRDGAGSFQGSVTSSITDANVVLEGSIPGPGNGSFLFAGRRTYYDLVADRVTGESFPSFADLQLKSVWRFGPGHRLSVLGLTSREDSDFAFDDDAQDRGALLSDVGNDLLSVRLDALLGDRVTSTTIVSWYRNREFIDFAGSLRQEAQRSNAPDDDIAFGRAAVLFTRELEVRDASVRQEISVPLSAAHVVDVGAELHRIRSGVAFSTTGDRNISEANGSSIRGGVGLPDVLDSSLVGTRSALWVQDRWRPIERLTLEPGLRLEWSTANGDSTLSPRLGAGYDLAPGLRVRGAVGVFTQSPGYEKLIQSDYFIDLSNARELGVGHEHAVHAIVGIETDLGAGTLFRVEGYYKRFDRLIVGRLETDDEWGDRLSRYDFPEELRDSVPTQRLITSNPSNGAAGRAYGMDMFISRVDPAQRLTGWLSYTLGRAQQNAYGQRFPFDYDRRHALSAVGRYRLSRKWDIAATARLASGFRRTAPLGVRVAAVEDNRGRLIPKTDALGNVVYTVDLGGVSNLNKGQLPYYARVDLRGTYRPGGLTGRWSIYLEVINLLGRDNPVEIESQLAYDPGARVPSLVESRSQGFPRIPTFGLRVRF